VVLETERLVLREAVEADAPFILALLNSPGFLEHIGDRGVRTEGDARGYIVERMIGSYRTHGFGMWVTLERKGGRPVGLAGLVKRDGLDMPDVGYAFVADAWGQGYAQEAIQTVIGFAAANGVRKLTARTHLGNRRSELLLEKLGFEEEGVLRGHVLKDGERRDCRLFGLLL
jgi:RimJ/RimL family protein N-acetyltransferase